MYRVEIVEITSYAGDIERISSPAITIEDITELVKRFGQEYKEEIEREEYYIKIAFYNIKESE